MTPHSISTLFGLISKYTGGIKVWAHKVRHTYASNCMIDGVDIFAIQQQMGHADISTTQIYLYMNDKARAQKMQLLK